MFLYSELDVGIFYKTKAIINGKSCKNQECS